MALKGMQIIASEFRDSNNRGFAAVNPATGDVLEPRFSEASSAEIDSAAKAAANSFDQYRMLPIEQRATFLEDIGGQLTACASELIARTQAETALAESRLEGELTRTVNQLKLFASTVRRGSFVAARIERGRPERQPLPKPDIRSMLVPLGPVAVFGAGNFPLAFSVAGGDTASALAAGCPVVFKGHPAHPGACELAGQAIVKAIRKNGIPPGVFSLLHAEGTEAGAALVTHPMIRAVAFTGSLSGGRALYDLGCSRPEPIPVFAEMGSVNPVFVLPKSLSDRRQSLADGLIESMTLGVGQFCTSPGLIVAIRSAALDLFLASLASGVEARPSAIMLHEGLKKNFLDELNRLRELDRVSPLADTLPEPDGCQVTPVLLQTDARNLLDNPQIAREVFGPAAMVVVCDSTDELCAVAESLSGQLTATVHGTEDDLHRFQKLFGILQRKAGRLIINAFPTGVEVCPAMHHGGPYPATTDSRSTSVGTNAMQRFLRPVAYQGFPQELLPEPLRDPNPRKIWRMVDGDMSCEDL
ncbi:MAG: aldehyde dehydrogenase (NADP(+)) [Desulfuromonadales bacterium]